MQQLYDEPGDLASHAESIGSSCMGEPHIYVDGPHRLRQDDRICSRWAIRRILLCAAVRKLFGLHLDLSSCQYHTSVVPVKSQQRLGHRARTLSKVSLESSDTIACGSYLAIKRNASQTLTVCWTVLLRRGLIEQDLTTQSF